MTLAERDHPLETLHFDRPDPMMSLPRLAEAEWARCIGRGTPSSTGTWR